MPMLLLASLTTVNVCAQVICSSTEEWIKGMPYENVMGKHLKTRKYCFSIISMNGGLWCLINHSLKDNMQNTTWLFYYPSIYLPVCLSVYLSIAYLPTCCIVLEIGPMASHVVGKHFCHWAISPSLHNPSYRRHLKCQRCRWRIQNKS